MSTTNERLEKLTLLAQWFEIEGDREAKMIAAGLYAMCGAMKGGLITEFAQTIGEFASRHT